MKDLKIFTTNIEEQAKKQIDLLLEQAAFKECKIRIMPDVHAGAGCVIGFTANLGEKVIPNVVGVDIGCGMTWAKINKEIDLQKLDDIIREHIPSGMNIRDNIIKSNVKLTDLYCYKSLKNTENRLEKSMGTLGGGNHFIEVDVDTKGNYYLVVHSGSRNLGKQVCDIYQNIAIEYCSYKYEMQNEKDKAIKMLKELGLQKLIGNALKEIENKYKDKTKLPKELCYIEGLERDFYLHDMKLCQDWAKQNRATIINIICENLHITPIEIRETIHNYIGDDNIVRKGAISAKTSEIVLIPINMRDGCIIAAGKGNTDWNCSAPHGAGRIMSRAKAKETLRVEDYQKSMKGIFSTSICKETIDEAPMVYKPIQEIIDNIQNTVDIKEIIKPIYNYKAKE